MTRRPRLDLTEPQSLLLWAVLGFIGAIVFITVMVRYGPTEAERSNFYDSLGKSTHIRWR